MKTPDRRQACSGVYGEQLHLIEPPPFSPKWPKPSSLAGALIRDLLNGKTPTHPEFEGRTGSWRLAAYVLILRKLGWPIITIEIHWPSPDDPNRIVAKYTLPGWVRDLVGVTHG
jgi:hypothetical protein